MTWGELKIAVERRIKFHRLSVIDIDQTYGSDWDLEVFSLYSKFIRESQFIFVPPQALTLATNDIEIDLESATFIGSGRKLFEVTDVWVNKKRLERVNYGSIMEDFSPSATAGNPESYFAVGDGRIRFNRPCSSAFSNSYVAGFAHPIALASNSTVLDVDDHYKRDVSEYIAAHLAMDVASDEIQMEKAIIAMKSANAFVEKLTKRFRAQRIGVLER